jgi:DNA-binding NarL/FixJ family response regulator
LSKSAAIRPLAVAIDVGDPDLTEQLRALLADLPGLTVAPDGAPSDVRLVKSTTSDANIELTPREHDVLELLVDGASNKEIARRLGISASTVKFHVRSIADKLGADGRAEAVAHALRRGIIHL